MRDIIGPNHELGGINIMDIEIDVNSRDVMPSALLGRQTLYGNRQVRAAVRAVGNRGAAGGGDLNNVCPGMTLCAALVMAVVRVCRV